MNKKLLLLYSLSMLCKGIWATPYVPEINKSLQSSLANTVAGIPFSNLINDVPSIYPVNHDPAAATNRSQPVNFGGNNCIGSFLLKQVYAPLMFQDSGSTGPVEPTTRVISDGLTNPSGDVGIGFGYFSGNLFALSIPGSGMNGSISGGNFTTTGYTGLTDGTIIQDGTNVVGDLTIIWSGLWSGIYPLVTLQNGIITNASVTGTSNGTTFTGTNILTGTIATGTFDLLLVVMPTGMTFNIYSGDLGPTGTFTTTSQGYGRVFDSSLPFSTTGISNKVVQLLYPVSGTYNYLGTDYTGGSLSDVLFTGFNGTGSLSGTNIFVIDNPTTGATIANAQAIIAFNRSSLLENVTGTVLVAGSSAYASGIFTGINISSPYGAGTLSNDGTSYNNATVSPIINSCIEGYIDTGSGPVLVHINELTTPAPIPMVITNANILGVTQATLNGIWFTGTEILTGTFSVDPGVTTDGDFQAGNCP